MILKSLIIGFLQLFFSFIENCLDYDGGIVVRTIALFMSILINPETHAAA